MFHLKNDTILAELRGKRDYFPGICIGAKIASRISVSQLARVTQLSSKSRQECGNRPSCLLPALILTGMLLLSLAGSLSSGQLLGQVAAVTEAGAEPQAHIRDQHGA